MERKWRSRRGRLIQMEWLIKEFKLVPPAIWGSNCLALQVARAMGPSTITRCDSLMLKFNLDVSWLDVLHLLKILDVYPEVPTQLIPGKRVNLGSWFVSSAPLRRSGCRHRQCRATQTHGSNIKPLRWFYVRFLGCPVFYQKQPLISTVQRSFSPLENEQYSIHKARKSRRNHSSDGRRVEFLRYLELESRIIERARI